MSKRAACVFQDQTEGFWSYTYGVDAPLADGTPARIYAQAPIRCASRADAELRALQSGFMPQSSMAGV